MDAERPEHLQDLAGLRRRFALLEFYNEATVRAGCEGELVLRHAKRLADASDGVAEFFCGADRITHVPEREHSGFGRWVQEKCSRTGT